MTTITIYTSRKTGREYTFSGYINEGYTAVLVDDKGEKHLYAISTLKKNFKKSEITVETSEDKKEAKSSTAAKHQKIAAKNLKNAYTWNVRSYENSVQDGDLEEMPSVEEMFNKVLAEAKGSLYEDGCSGGKPPISMRLAGDKFLRKTLKALFEADGYEVPSHLLEGKPKVKGSKRGVIRCDEGNTVRVVAFTGMVIGDFEIHQETDNTISVIGRQGQELIFSKETGKQLNSKNPRFANKIERGE